MRKFTYAYVILVAFLFWNRIVLGQITTPPSGDNQKSSVTQYMGLASVTVNYSSPNVHAPDGTDRAGHIWGELVPYGLSNLAFGLSTEEHPSPWRAGANENTTISFSHDMKIEGKDIKAGTYGLHMIPGKETWTIILSNNANAWGSFFYDEKDDALRFTVTPKSSAYNEWLTYEFSDRELSSCSMELKWENLTIPVHIEVPDITELYYQKIKGELEGTPIGFNYLGWVDGANYLAQNKYKLDEALKWADNALAGQFYSSTNFITMSTKANVLNAMGKTAEAEEMMKKAVNDPTATAMDVHFYARGLQAQNKNKEALEIFLINYKNHPDQVVTSLGLARGYSANGDYKNAIKYAKVALTMNPDPQMKKTLEDGIKKLEEGKDFN